MNGMMTGQPIRDLAHRSLKLPIVSQAKIYASSDMFPGWYCKKRFRLQGGSSATPELIGSQNELASNISHFLIAFARDKAIPIGQAL